MSAARKLEPQMITDRLDDLPTLPTIVYELSRVINDPMSSTSEVEKIMSNDQSLTTKVLQLANSAYYSIPGGVTSLQRAIAYIGYDTIHQLVLSTSIINALGTKGSEKFDLNSFWKHSIGVAMAAEATAKFVGFKTPSDLFTCGLVHDMGKVALFIAAPDAFFETIDFAKENEITISEAEERFQTIRHTQVGRELALRWRLPAMIQAATSHHHQRDTGLRGGLSQEMNLIVDIVFLANLLVHALQYGNSGHSKVLGVPKDVLERMQLTPDKLKDLISSIKISIKSADGFLKVIGA
jgi:putative nucleotidyltransferase with HDIG domain